MRQRPGPTGDFPQGQLRPSDEGGLNVAVFINGGRVVMDFGKSVAWFAMGPAEAREFAAKFLQLAAELES